jgi:hypothetical protein
VRRFLRHTPSYLKNHSERLDSSAARRGGYHIGSGAMESANKFIAHVRFKRSGAWWYPTKANNILKLRCAKYKGVFDRVMKGRLDRNAVSLTPNSSDQRERGMVPLPTLSLRNPLLKAPSQPVSASLYALLRCQGTLISNARAGCVGDTGHRAVPLMTGCHGGTWLETIDD